jgi:urease accessory protein
MADIDFELLQLNDSTFPIGAYTLSWGLETFVQQKIIHDSQSALEYLESEIASSFITNELLPVRLSYEYVSVGQWNKVLEFDEIYNAAKSAREIREGSKKITARFFKTVCLWQKEEGDVTNHLPKINHFPVIYGAYCALKNIPLDDALKTFLYSQFSARVTTLVKLIPLSQNEGQKILHSLFENFEEILLNVTKLGEDDLCRSCPSSEIRGMQHEYLYTRLYMS